MKLAKLGQNFWQHKSIFQPRGILIVLQIIYCFCSSISTSLFLFQMAVSRYLASYFCRYQSSSHSPPHEQNFGNYFLVFGNCGSEHIYMRPKVNSNWFEISLQGKTSLRCEVTSLIV